MHSLDYTITSEHTEIPAQTGRLETRVPGGASSIPCEQHTRLLWQPTSRHIYSGPEGHTDTNNKAGDYIYQRMSQSLWPPHSLEPHGPSWSPSSSMSESKFCLFTCLECEASLSNNSCAFRLLRVLPLELPIRLLVVLNF